MVCTHSKVTKEDELIAAVDVLCLRWGGQGWGIGADEYDWFCRVVEAVRQQAF